MYTKRIILAVLLYITIFLSMSSQLFAVDYSAIKTTVTATNTSTFVYSDDSANMAQITLTFKDAAGDTVTNSTVEFYMEADQSKLLGWVADGNGNLLINLDGNTMASDDGQQIITDTDENGKVIIKIGSNNLITTKISFFNEEGVADGILIDSFYVSFHLPDISEPPFTVVPKADNITHDSFKIVTQMEESGNIYYIVVTADNAPDAPTDPADVKEWATNPDADTGGILVDNAAFPITEETRESWTIGQLTPETDYVALIVADDSDGTLTDIKTVTVQTFEMSTAQNQDYSAARSWVKATNTSTSVYAGDPDNMAVFTLTFKTHNDDYLVNSPVEFYIWSDQEEFLGWVEDSSGDPLNLDGNIMATEIGQQIITNTNELGKVIVNIGANNETSGTIEFYNEDGADEGILIGSSNVNFYLPDTSCPLPGNGGIITIDNKTKSSVNLKWTIATDDTDSADVLQYRVYYSVGNNIGSVTDMKTNGAAFGEYTANIDGCEVTGLSSDTTYYFNVMVKDQAGNEGAYTTVEAKTAKATTGGGGGGGGGGSTPANPPAPIAPPIIHPGLENVKTPDDTKLNDNLKQLGEAKLDLSGDTDQKAVFSGEVVGDLLKNNLSLTIANQEVTVKFSPAILGDLNVQEQQGSVLELGAKVIATTEKEQILATAQLGTSTGIFEIGGKIIDLTAKITSNDGTSSKVASFSEPVAVIIDLADLNLNQEQIKELCGTRLEKDAAGNTVMVKLGGSYDPETKTFTFYTDKFSLYSVMQVINLATISVTLDLPITKVNGVYKPIDVPPTIINNRTMVPLRFIGEALGAELNWNAETKTVIITLNGKEVKMVIDQPTFGMDTPPTIVQGRTLVPVRFISESLGADVVWYPSNKTVSIVK